MDCFLHSLARLEPASALPYLELLPWRTVQAFEWCHLFKFNVLYYELYFMMIIAGSIDFAFCYLSQTHTLCFALLTFVDRFRHHLFWRCANQCWLWKVCALLDIHAGLHHHKSHLMWSTSDFSYNCWAGLLTEGNAGACQQRCGKVHLIVSLGQTFWMTACIFMKIISFPDC